ncbi:MAG: hypothetical protein GX231_02795 [Tissierellia bacterium]|jgi:hypothetical protein|nr:hypothetical protein [Tissierellia bacterium]
MQKLDYELIHKLDLDTTNKVFDFIIDEYEIDNILDNLKSDFPFLMDNGNKLILNSWLSIDYIHDDGKTFIEKFIDSKPKNISTLEREFLLYKKNSFISLFEVLNIDDDYILVHDLLQNKKFALYEKLMKEYFNEGDIVFARIGKFFDKCSIVGDISFLPKSAKDIFIEQYLYDFNYKRKEESTLIIKDYIKKHSIEIIKIYNNCILSVLELDDDLNLYLYDELNDFESYLANKSNAHEIKEHIANLLEFYDYYLAEDGLTLYDLKDLDLKVFFELAIREGFIYSTESLNSYISTFKNYIHFLSKIDSDFEEKYQEIRSISNNRFKLMDKLNFTDTLFSIDRNLVNDIEDILNDTSILLLLNLDKFLVYLTDNRIEVTPVKKKIKKKFLPELCFLFNDDEIIDSLNPGQRELALLDFFYELSLALNLISIKEDIIILNKNGINFLNLKDEKKFSVILNCVWKHIEKMNAKERIMEFIKDLKNGKTNDLKDLIYEYRGSPKEAYQIHEYFKILGLTKTTYLPIYTWEISKLGMFVLIYYYNKEFKDNKSSIIYLNNYRGKIVEREQYGKP